MRMCDDTYIVCVCFTAVYAVCGIVCMLLLPLCCVLRTCVAGAATSLSIHVLCVALSTVVWYLFVHN